VSGIIVVLNVVF